MSDDRQNSGRLSRNERKEKDTHPDMKGSARINGVDYWISGWTKENERGRWLSLSFTPKDDAAKQRAPKDDRGDLSPDADVPF